MDLRILGPLPAPRRTWPSQRGVVHRQLADSHAAVLGPRTEIGAMSGIVWVSWTTPPRVVKRNRAITGWEQRPVGRMNRSPVGRGSCGWCAR